MIALELKLQSKKGQKTLNCTFDMIIKTNKFFSMFELYILFLIHEFFTNCQRFVNANHLRGKTLFGTSCSYYMSKPNDSQVFHSDGGGW